MILGEGNFRSQPVDRVGVRGGRVELGSSLSEECARQVLCAGQACLSVQTGPKVAHVSEKPQTVSACPVAGITGRSWNSKYSGGLSNEKREELAQ